MTLLWIALKGEMRKGKKTEKDQNKNKMYEHVNDDNWTQNSR